MMDSPQVFLSHAGDDSVLALAIAARLKRDLFAGRLPIRVFNTSAPEDRFRNFADAVAAGEQFSLDEWEAELREYLRQHIHASAAYVLLVTPQSLRKRSKWIQFEIDTAYDEQERGAIGFIPCAADGAHLVDLPPKANVFQGVDISQQAGFREIDRNCDLLLRAVAGLIKQRNEGSSVQPG